MEKDEQLTGNDDMSQRTREEILENDLSGVSVGDYIFHTRFGFAKVDLLNNYGNYFIIADRGFSVTAGGKTNPANKHPSAFLSIDHCIEYFQTIKRIEEEKNVWTWEKIQACDKIDFGARVVFSCGAEKLIGKKTCDYVVAFNKSTARCWISCGDIVKNLEFYDRNGNLIDPKDY